MDEYYIGQLVIRFAIGFFIGWCAFSIYKIVKAAKGDLGEKEVLSIVKYVLAATLVIAIGVSVGSAYRPKNTLESTNGQASQYAEVYEGRTLEELVEEEIRVPEFQDQVLYLEKQREQKQKELNEVK